ncbi:MAG: hypothetical protein H6739_29365 [Alphaproteobacteria bacterium]|nr:hypothetical protein [Alphaproteobacteria bacterium]
MTNKLTKKQRLRAVEDAIRSRGWSWEIAQELVAKTGWSERTIYRDRDVVLDILADEEAKDLPRRRAKFLADLRRVARKAEKAEKFSPAARLLDMESKVLGLDRVPLPQVDENENEELDTSLEAVLVEVRRMRRQAQAGHSYVAADRLLAREHEIVESIRLRDLALKEAEMAHLDEGALVELVIDSVSGLPDQLRSRLRAALGDGEDG